MLSGSDIPSSMTPSSSDRVPIPSAGGRGREEVLWPFVAVSGAFMVAWVLGPFTGSALTGTPEHDAFVQQIFL
jgi:hypothetical protein